MGDGQGGRGWEGEASMEKETDLCGCHGKKEGERGRGLSILKYCQLDKHIVFFQELVEV